jgi:hypothetical protein
MKTISKPDWGRKTGFSRCVPTLDYFTLSQIFEANDSSSSLAKSVIVHQTILSWICHEYHNICQTVARKLGQPIGWMCVVRGRAKKKDRTVGMSVFDLLGRVCYCDGGLT